VLSISAGAAAAAAVALMMDPIAPARVFAQSTSATATPAAVATQGASPELGASIRKPRAASARVPAPALDASAAPANAPLGTTSGSNPATVSIAEPNSESIGNPAAEAAPGRGAHHKKSNSTHPSRTHSDRPVVAKADSSSTATAPADDSSAGPFSSLQFTSKKGPIDIKSDALDLDYKGNMVTFRGHVRAAQGDAILTSNTLTVTYAGKDFHDLKQMVADQNVRMSQGTRWATGERAVLDQTNHTVILTGSPVVHDGNDEVTGSKITVHLDTGKSEVEGARAMFFPNEQKTRDNKKATVAKSP
jgi:lipopolysaccharide export system protein LptA